jgi:SAM-dependent methyltransferase
MKTANKFWKNSKEYPPFPFRYERRLCDLEYIVPKLKGVKSFLDLGCGDGWLIKCLQGLTDIKTFYAYDLSENLLGHVSGAQKKVYDINAKNPEPLPPVDVVYMGAVTQYVEDKPLIEMLKNLKCPVIIKTPCADTQYRIDGESKELGGGYASIYRSLPDMYELLAHGGYAVKTVERAYSDSLESKFGTKQVFLLCYKKK